MRLDLVAAQESSANLQRWITWSTPWQHNPQPFITSLAGLYDSLAKLAGPEDTRAKFAAELAETKLEYDGYYFAFTKTAAVILPACAAAGLCLSLILAWIVALQNRRSQRAVRTQQVLFTIGLTTAHASCLEEMLERIHRELRTLFDAPNFFVALYDKASKHYSFPYYVDELDTDFSPQPLENSITDYVRRTGKPLLWDSHRPVILPGLETPQKFGPLSPSWMGVPLCTSRGLSGVVCVQTYNHHFRYTPEHLTLLDMVAPHIALAVERKQAEDALKQSESNYRSFVEESEDGIWCIALNPPIPTDLSPEEQLNAVYSRGRIVDCNSTYAQRNGFATPAELINQPLSKLRSDDDNPRKQALLDMILSGYRQHEYELIHPGPDGMELITLNNVVGLVEDDHLTLVWGIQRDVTDQRISQRVLAESERMYSSLVRNLPGIVFRTSNNDNLTLEYVSEAVEEITGYPAADFIDARERSITSLMEPAMVRVYRQEVLEAIKHRNSYETTYPITRSDGSKRWLREIGQAVYDESGRFLALDGLIFDITNQLQVEENQRLLATAVEHAADSIVITDPQGVVLYVNPAFERTSRFKKAEVIGKDASLLKSSQHDEQFYQQLWSTVHSGKTWQGRLASQCADGSIIEEEVTISPVFSTSGWIQHVVAVKRDITKDSQLNARIQQAQKMESLAVLAGGIAHDFNNLLMGILGNASLALMELPPEGVVSLYIKDIETAGRRASELSRQMLAYSGKGHFTFQTTDLSALVSEIAQLLEVSIPKDINIQFNLENDLPAVAGDPTQLRQVVMNLITNARDAIINLPGRIILRTGVENCDSEYLASLYPYSNLAAGQYCYLEVSDDGNGMDSATLQRIFEPFFSTKASGHGLGLAAVLGIVRGHQGALKVHSEVGIGTTFTVYIPKVSGAVELPNTPDIPSDVTGQQHGTILVVDDEPTVRLVASRILSKYGFHVLTADNGRNAVDLFRTRSTQIDAVLMDMTMPQLSGEEASREILGMAPETKIILSSGFTKLETIDSFSDLKLAGFIQKPYRAQDLVEKLKHVLSLDQQHRNGAA